MARSAAVATLLLGAACGDSEGTNPTTSSSSSSGGGGGGASTSSSSSAGGAGGAEESFPLFRSGSRLRAVHYSGGPGSHRFLRFHDTVLDTTCNFGISTNGEQRCYPTANAGLAGYEDAECTLPLYQCSDCVAGATHARIAERARCSSRPLPHDLRAYAVTGATTPSTIYVSDGTSCTPQANTAPRVRLTPVADAALAGGSTALQSAGEAYASLHVQGDDGSSALTSSIAVAYTRPCSGASGGSASGECVPQPAASLLNVYHESPTCEGPLATAGAPPEGCGGPVMAVRSSSGTVAELRELVSLYQGDVYTGSPSFSCQQLQTSPLQFHRLGDEAFLPSRAQSELGTGAARPMHYVSASGVVMEPISHWVDVARSRRCQVRSTSPTTYRCVDGIRMNVHGSVPMYSDPSCQTLLAQGVGNELDDLALDFDAEGHLVRVREAVPYAGPVYYVTGAQCVELSLPSNFIRSLGDDVSLESFPEVELLVE